MNNLSAYIEGIALKLYGEPSSKRGHEWRYGTHGSLCIDTRKGIWFDHEEGKGGGITGLIEREFNTTIEGVADILEREFGVPKQSQNGLTPKRHVVARFDYYGADGALAYQVERYEPKDFRQRQPDQNGGWVYNMKGATPVPYNLPAIVQKPDEPILIVEGEKAADALIKHGLVATTNHGGAKNWKPELNQWFEGRKVIVIPDNDEAGRNHANVVIDQLYGVAHMLKRVALPGLPEKGDVVDWFDMGMSVSDLASLCKSADVIDRKPPEAKPESRALKTLDMNDLMNMPPVDWLVDGMITSHGFSVVYGAPGIGKSFLSIDMALCIAYGDEWHGRATKRGGVLYIAGEGVGGMGVRVKAWMAHNRKENFTDFHVVPQTVKMLEAEGVEAVIETIESFDVEFKLVVIDTLARTLAATGNDENSATDTGLLIEQCNEIQRRCGLAVLAVAHSGKDSSRGLRGSSAVLGGADTVLAMTGGDGIAALKMEKQKDAESVEPMNFQLVPISLVEGSSAVLVPTEQQVKEKQGKRLSPLETLVYKALQTEIIDSGASGVPKARWEVVCRRDIADPNKSSLSTARSQAQKKGFVEIKNGLAFINKRLDE